MTDTVATEKLNTKDVKRFTEGSLFRNILLFSLPLMLSQVLQVLFNISDVIIVGKGSANPTIPVGAVGSNSTLLTLFTGFLIGLGAGVNVRVAQYLGAKKQDDVQSTVSTSLVLSVIMGLLIFAVCFIFAENILVMLETKSELLDKAVIYLKIYSCGMPAMAIFNYGNGVLSAAGDTRRPLIYLTASGIMNIGLNFFFVLVCKLDVEGVALASIITQYVSAVLVMVRITTVKGDYKLDFKKFVFSGKKAAEVLYLGIPAGLQNAIFAIANIFIQKSINHTFPYKVVTGNGVSQNVDSVIYNVMMAFYTACSTFIGQNYGAGKKDRVLKSYFISTGYAFVIGSVLGISGYIFGRPILSLFDPDLEVVAAGMEKLKIMGVCYGIGAFMDASLAASRGLGKSLAPTIIVIMGSCVFRFVWLYTVFAKYQTIPSLYLLYPVSWVITAVFEIAYFFMAYKKLVEKPQPPKPPQPITEEGKTLAETTVNN